MVECEPERGSESLSARIEETAARVGELGFRLGVLLERDPDPRLLRMYIVAARGDQAVLAVERIEDRPEPDIDRSLALKVGDAYGLVELVRAAAPENAMPLAAVTARAPQPSQPASAPSAAWQLFLDAGGGPHVDGDRVRWLANLALGVGRRWSDLRIEAGAGVRFAANVQERNAFGQVSMRERGVLASLRVLWRGTRVELGGVLEGLFLSISAEGLPSSGGRPGAETFFTPVFGLGADLRVRLFASAFLRAAPMLELLRNERLAIDDHLVAETGPVRVALPLSLLVSLPLQRGLQP